MLLLHSVGRSSVIRAHNTFSTLLGSGNILDRDSNRLS